MKTLYVRVQPRSGQETFFRCGMEFSKAWKTVDVDDATAARLQAEQMLEVEETVDEVLETLPADAVAPVALVAAPITPDSASSPADAGASTDGQQALAKEASAPQATTPAAAKKKAGK